MKWKWALGGAAVAGATWLMISGDEESGTIFVPPPLPPPPVGPNQGLLKVTYRLELPRLARFSSDADPVNIQKRLLESAPSFSAAIHEACPGAPIIGTQPAVQVVAQGSDRFVEMLYLATFADTSTALAPIRDSVLACIRETMLERSPELKKYMRDLAVVRVK